MSSHYKLALLGGYFLFCLSWHVAAAPDPPHYTAVDLGTLGGQISSVAAVNNRGEVVGASETSLGSTHAFLWSHHRMRDLGTLGGWDSTACGINDRGQIVGNADAPRKDEYNHFVQHGVLWQHCKPRDLGLFLAEAINNEGRIAGWVSGSRASEMHYLCLWRNGRMRHLDTFGPDGNEITSMNDNGDMIIHHTASGGEASYIRRKGKLISMGDILCGDCDFYAINNKGQAVGHLCGKSVLWHNGKTKTLPDLSGQFYCIPRGLNIRGQVVGCAAADKDRALLWSNGQVYDLSRLIPPGSGWQLEDAVSINNLGQITGIRPLA